MTVRDFIFGNLINTGKPLHVCVASVPKTAWSVAGLNDEERFNRFMNKVKKERKRREDAAAHEKNLRKEKGCIRSVTFNPPHTTAVWNDGTITMVTCPDGVEFSKEQGVLNCMAKYLYGNDNMFNSVLSYWGKNGRDVEKKGDDIATEPDGVMLGA